MHSTNCLWLLQNVLLQEVPASQCEDGFWTVANSFIKITEAGVKISFSWDFYFLLKKKKTKFRSVLCRQTSGNNCIRPKYTNSYSFLKMSIGSRACFTNTIGGSTVQTDQHIAHVTLCFRNNLRLNTSVPFTVTWNSSQRIHLHCLPQLAPDTNVYGSSGWVLLEGGYGVMVSNVLFP